MSLQFASQIFSITDFRTETKKITESLEQFHAVMIMKGSKKFGILIDEEQAQKYQDMEEKLEYQSILIAKLQSQLNPERKSWDQLKLEIEQKKQATL